jgi:hypothetical protein
MKTHTIFNKQPLVYSSQFYRPYFGIQVLGLVKTPFNKVLQGRKGYIDNAA